jgi:hypothetical protein
MKTIHLVKLAISGPIAVGIMCYFAGRVIKKIMKKYDEVGCDNCRDVCGAHENFGLGFRCKCVPLHVRFLRLATPYHISSNFAARRRQIATDLFVASVMFSPIISIGTICCYRKNVSLLDMFSLSAVGGCLLEIACGGKGTMAQNNLYTLLGACSGIVMKATVVAFEFNSWEE